MTHPDTRPQAVQQPKKEHCKSPENSPGAREPSLSSEPFQSTGSHQRRTNGLQSHCCGQKHDSWTPQMLPHSCAVGRARSTCGKAARVKRILHLSAGKRTLNFCVHAAAFRLLWVINICFRNPSSTTIVQQSYIHAKRVTSSYCKTYIGRNIKKKKCTFNR